MSTNLKLDEYITGALFLAFHLVVGSAAITILPFLRIIPDIFFLNLCEF